MAIRDHWNRLVRKSDSSGSDTTAISEEVLANGGPQTLRPNSNAYPKRLSWRPRKKTVSTSDAGAQGGGEVTAPSSGDGGNSHGNANASAIRRESCQTSFDTFTFKFGATHARRPSSDISPKTSRRPSMDTTYHDGR